MKKNMMMRIASVLLIAVLISTCGISGTYAKYVTSDTGSDSARVAKWGVTVLVSGTLFGENYEPYLSSDLGNEISATAKNSVDSFGGNIVAPGTENTQAGMSLSIAGQPEVATTIKVTKIGNHETIFLKAGTYAVMVPVPDNKIVTADNVTNYYCKNGDDYVQADALGAGEYYEVHDVVTVADDYYPVVFTWTTSGGAVEFTTVSALYTHIENYFNGAVAPKKSLDKSGVITWKWEFSQGVETDKADTILGNLQAEAIVVETIDSGVTYKAIQSDKYNLTVDFGATITVTQVN